MKPRGAVDDFRDLHPHVICDCEDPSVEELNLSGDLFGDLSGSGLLSVVFFPSCCSTHQDSRALWVIRNTSPLIKSFFFNGSFVIHQDILNPLVLVGIFVAGCLAFPE